MVTFNFSHGPFAKRYRWRHMTTFQRFLSIARNESKLFVFVLLIGFAMLINSQPIVSVQYYTDSNCSDLAFTANWTVETQCQQGNTDGAEAVSVSDMVCYQGQLCYRLFESSADCSEEGNIGYATSTCTPPLDDSPYYSKIVSGTDSCGVAPTDLDCAAELVEVSDSEEEPESESGNPRWVNPRDLTVIIFLLLVAVCEVVAVIKAVLLYRAGPPPNPNEITLTDLSIEPEDHLDLSLDQSDEIL